MKKIKYIVPVVLVVLIFTATQVFSKDNPCDRIKDNHIEFTGAYIGNAQAAAESIQKACDKRNHIANGDGSGVLKDSENVKKVEKEKPVKKRTFSSVEAPKPNRVDTPTIPKSDSPFINRLNKIRVAAGLKPFYQSDQLNADAQRWANEMSRTGYRHSGYGGEVIAYSCNGYFKDVLQAWMDSPPHKAILMGYGTYVGYGQVQKGDCTWYVSWVG